MVWLGWVCGCGCFLSWLIFGLLCLVVFSGGVGLWFLGFVAGWGWSNVGFGLVVWGGFLDGLVWVVGGVLVCVWVWGGFFVG